MRKRPLHFFDSDMGKNLTRFSEDNFLRWIRRESRGRRHGVLIDIGDDAAFLRFGDGRCVATTDILVDGVHFRLAEAGPHLVGRKAMAKNLSDIAAMGCVPRYALASVIFPRTMTPAAARAIARGLASMGRRFGTIVVGGDVVVHAGPLTINVVVLGEAPAGRAPVTRSGARVGDRIMVTGPLGGSIRSRHLRFLPRVREGLMLNRKYRIHAMIDISDGLARDLSHMCDESGVGAALESAKIPISAAARAQAKIDGLTPLDHALHDGEDYELLLASPRKEAERIASSGLAIEIGEIVRGQGAFLRDRGGIRRLRRGGYEHRS